uniref:Uncharacterized protein LOC107472332 isoform X2 n=1 Tax=Rhizophora mucronata TaxID=61149 RepID=A0A2P2MLX6_RHIMU
MKKKRIPSRISSLLLLFLRRMLFRGVMTYFGHLLWDWKGAALLLALTDWIEWVLPVIGDLTLSVGGGASSSKRPRFDLNLPPAEELESASTSAPEDPQPLPLSIAEQVIRNRLKRGGGAHVPDAQLLEEVRAIARCKGQIVDRMFELDIESPEFWRQHREAIIQDSILTTNQTEYPSRLLLRKLADLRNSNVHTSATYRNMLKIRKKFHELGTLKF